jgi:putative CocE/NonD family hydrolase
MYKAIEGFNIPESHSPPPSYDRKPSFGKMLWERDVMVPMRDGINLCTDIYRPDTQEKVPVLLALGPHNKELQTPDLCDAFGPSPAWSSLWIGAQEAGDTKYFVSRGYAHVVANYRGIGKSEDNPLNVSQTTPNFDAYDLIEWLARQPWCDGNVGMVGISAFAGAQWEAASQQPPHLKAIFPYDALTPYLFRDTTPGGVLHSFEYLTDQLSVNHMVKSRPGTLPPQLEKLWQEAINNPDYKMYGNFYNVLTQKGQQCPMLFSKMLYPYDTKDASKKGEAFMKKIKVPAYTGSGWYSYTYKAHIQGCQNWYAGIDVPKKLLLTGPAHLPRPWQAFHGEILKWYDYWLKGIDTGIMNEPRVKVWVMGANNWYYADDWPVPGTDWKRLYLHSWGRLREDPFTPNSRDDYSEPDAFVQMPPTQTRKIERLRYMTEPLPQDTLIVGPSVLNLYASIDQVDTNWIVSLKDVGPDVSVRTARERENEFPQNISERELTRGWLKASLRDTDPARSKPYKPWHRLTQESQKLVSPGEINEYNIEIISTANLFEKGHRICIDIMSLDMPTGTGGFTNVEYIPYHICSSKITLHKIYHNEKYPSHLLLPIIQPVS